MHTWKFFRTGGLDQVCLESAADLLNLGQLDQKLWVALSCPVKGLELDETTLAMIDSDGDGRIRVPELVAAVNWAAARLKDPGMLLQGCGSLSLSAINDATPEGRIVLSSARQILASSAKPDSDSISADDVSDTAKVFSASLLNGDGIVPPEAAPDAQTRSLINDIVACLGGTADRAGSPGVTAEKSGAFFAEAAACLEWLERGSGDGVAVLGAETAAAFAALQAVSAKVEDYFIRCRLAAFDSRAAPALNRSEGEYAAIASKDLTSTSEDVARLPLARIEAGRALPLSDGVNPVWAAALAALRRLTVAPILGPDRTALTEADWAALNSKFTAYEAWLGGKPGSAVEKLGAARLKEIFAGKGREALGALLARENALGPEFEAIGEVKRLVHYCRDMRSLLCSFVNFADFYSRDRWAVFQVGTLYLDSRSTELCVRVDGPAPLAAMSKTYLAYCDCTRPGGAAMTIAACFTQGSSDYLFAGCHGVFYDRKGRDWDAVVTSIVDNPVSLRQAFWSPYKKFIRLIDEMIARRAAAADAAANDRLTAAAKLVSEADKEAEKARDAAPKKVDVGTVAAISVGLGAIGGALAAVGTGLAKLTWWQYPVVIVSLMLAISLPAVVIAWLKIRQRTLGPILDANGWAINGRVKINIPLGRVLTDVAAIPPGARRSLEDPYKDKDVARMWFIAVIVLILAAVAIRVDHHYRGHYFWESSAAPAAEAPAK
jgi:hypothetical protein